LTLFWVTITIESDNNVKRGERSERKTRRAPIEAFLSLAFSLYTSLTPYFDPKQGQGVEIAL
jgi:hypothetical protein